MRANQLFGLRVEIWTGGAELPEVFESVDQIIFPGETQDNTSPPAQGVVIVKGTQIDFYPVAAVRRVHTVAIPK